MRKKKFTTTASRTTPAATSVLQASASRNRRRTSLDWTVATWRSRRDIANLPESYRSPISIRPAGRLTTTNRHSFDRDVGLGGKFRVRGQDVQAFSLPHKFAGSGVR